MKHLLLTIVAAVVLVGCGGESSHELLYHSIDDANIKAVEQHIATGADVNFKYSDGTTPLYIAAYYGRKEIAELLIAEGADVNAGHDDGESPLEIAINNDHKEITELLIAEGVDVNAYHLHIAAEGGAAQEWPVGAARHRRGVAPSG